MVAKYPQIGCFLLLVALLCSVSSCGVSRKKMPLPYLQDSCFSNASVGFLVVDAQTGDTLARHHSTTYFTPASLQKLATTYVALRYVGDSIADFLYRIKDSHLVIRPLGSPTLYDTSFEKTMPFFDEIESRFPHLDYTIEFPASPVPPYANGWSWEDFTSSFLSPISPLVVAKNESYIHTNSNASFAFFPPCTQALFSFVFSDIQNFPCAPFGPVYREMYSNTLYVCPDATIKKDSMRVSIFPEYATLTQLLSCYAQRPFVWRIASPLTPYADSSWAAYSAVPTHEVLKKMLLTSDNFLAQQLLLHAQIKRHCSYEPSELLQRLSQTDGVDLPQPFQWTDGSGLSRYNTNTPENLVDMLRKIRMLRDTAFLKEVLPEVGEHTLKSWNIPQLKGKLFAKTGSMRGVYNLAGLLFTARHRPLIFCVMVNGAPQRNVPCFQRALYDWFLKF